MACRTINDRRIGDVFTIMDHDGPDIDEAEQSNVGELLEWKHKWEQVVWYRLSETIEWMESMAGIRCRHDPLVVSLMKSLVDSWVMKTSVDEVNKTIGEEDEDREL